MGEVEERVLEPGSRAPLGLTPAELQHFHERGWVHKRGVIGKRAIAAVASAINAQVDHCSETCTLPAEGMSIQRHCCDYDSNYFKEDFLTQQKNERETITHSAFYFIAVSEFLLREFPSGNDAAIARVPDLPPLPSVRRHVLHQVFLI